MSIARHFRIVDCGTEEDSMNEGLKIAFASSDMHHVDQHFGSARSFVMYEVLAEHAFMSDAVEFGELAQDGNEDKLDSKIAALSGCAAVYVLAIGGGAVAKLARIGVHPLKVQPRTPIANLVGDVQRQLRDGSSPWIARALRCERDDESRFNAMEAEGWSE